MKHEEKKWKKCEEGRDDKEKGTTVEHDRRKGRGREREKRRKMSE